MKMEEEASMEEKNERVFSNFGSEVDPKNRPNPTGSVVIAEDVSVTTHIQYPPQDVPSWMSTVSFPTMTLRYQDGISSITLSDRLKLAQGKTRIEVFAPDSLSSAMDTSRLGGGPMEQLVQRYTLQDNISLVPERDFVTWKRTDDDLYTCVFICPKTHAVTPCGFLLVAAGQFVDPTTGLIWYPRREWALEACAGYALEDEPSPRRLRYTRSIPPRLSLHHLHELLDRNDHVERLFS